MTMSITKIEALSKHSERVIKKKQKFFPEKIHNEIYLYLLHILFKINLKIKKQHNI